MTEQNHRSLIISLDGATWTVLQPLVESGRLPTLADLVTSGIGKKLQSVIPPITSAAWFSFQTGTIPARHGVFTFSHVTNDGRESTTVNATTSGQPTLWEYLDEHGLSSISVNLPGTYPATELPNRAVSGIFAPSYEDEAAVDPPEIRGFVKAVCDDYGILTNPRDRHDPHTDQEEYIAAMAKNTRSRGAVTRRLMSEYDDWDVTMMHVQATDVLQHPMWKYLDPEHPAYEESMYDLVAGFYEVVDEIIGEVINQARDQADALDVYVISDHGFQGIETQAYMDRLLEEAGLLIRTESSLGDRLLSAALQLGLKADIFGLRSRFLSKDNRVSLGHTMNTGDVNWEQSVAWGHGNLYGYVYLLDESLKSDVMAAIEQYVGDGVVESVVDIEKVYDDVHSEAPDFVVVPAEEVSIDTSNESEGPIAEGIDYDSAFHIGSHEMDGILIMDGSDVTGWSGARTPKLVDVMPTILHRHSVGIPEDLDGSPLVEAFENNNEPTTIPSLDGRPVDGSIGHEVRDEVEVRLRNLGYRE